MENFSISATSLQSQEKVMNKGKSRAETIGSVGRTTVVTDWSSFESLSFRDLVPVAHGSEETEAFFIELVRLLLEYMKQQTDRSTKVLDFHHPHQLKEIMSHCLDIPSVGVSLEQLLSDCKETLKYCVRRGHPRFFNHLSSGSDVISVAGEWLTDVANANMVTYETAPTFMLMEEVVLHHMISKIGWEKGDGVFAPGGTISNLYAVLLARYKCAPEIKCQGMSNHKFVIFTSVDSHYSVKQAGAVVGIGTDNVVLVNTDDCGKMDVICLEEKVIHARSQGKTPLLVSATASTTVLGAFDPIDDIADVCAKHDLWLHVDAAWGGAYLLSAEHRYKLEGIHRAQSVTWNPHKLMTQNLQCSAFLTRHLGLLNQCNAMCADYLFHEDREYDVNYDTGDKTIQCGRRNDIFKLWLAWRAKGDAGFEEHVNRVHNLSRYFLERIRESRDFELVIEEPESTNVCFWYVPPSLRHIRPGPERDRYLNKVAPRIKAALMEAGTAMITYQPLRSIPNFFRYVSANPATVEDDLDFLLKEIARLGDATDVKREMLRKPSFDYSSSHY